MKISTYDANGLLTQAQELKLLESRLPAGYVGARDFTAMGYTLLGADDTRGYYATTLSYVRDARGNIAEQRDASGAATMFVYDADGVYPISSTDPRGSVTQFVFAPKSGEPASILFADGRRVRYEYDPIGRLAASFETDDAGSRAAHQGVDHRCGEHSRHPSPQSLPWPGAARARSLRRERTSARSPARRSRASTTTRSARNCFRSRARRSSVARRRSSPASAR